MVAFGRLFHGHGAAPACGRWDLPRACATLPHANAFMQHRPALLPSGQILKLTRYPKSAQDAPGFDIGPGGLKGSLLGAPLAIPGQGGVCFSGRVPWLGVGPGGVRRGRNQVDLRESGVPREAPCHRVCGVEVVP
jgi:hypothetical protein